MNTRKSIFTAGAIAAFACSLAFGQQQAGQQSPQQQQQQQQQQRQQAQQQAQSGQQQSQQAILGSDISEKQVKSQDGQELGQVDDLALHLESGHVGYVLVSEQGQSGEWKPVPASALEISGQGEQVELKVNIDQQKWGELESVGEQDLAQLSEEERATKIHEAFGEQYQASQQSGELKLASKVMENKLTNQQDQEIGQVTDLVMNPQDGSIGFLLIESEQAQGTFAVAPQAIEESGEAQYQLDISQQDFQQAQELRMEEVAQRSQQAQGAQSQESPQLYRFQESQSQSSAIYGAPQQREQQQRQEQQRQTESGSREAIRIQQPAPDVQVQQPSPEVSVQQPAPDVRVQQPPPQIRVQVEQPPPQVSVQQPEPEVNVEQAQPQVSVRQQEPEVSVQQAQPQVRVQRGEPNVNVQQEGQAQVQVERQGEPQVTVERDAQSQEGETTYGSPEQRRMQESQQRLQNRQSQQGQQQSQQSKEAEERARQMREQQQQQEQQQQ